MNYSAHYKRLIHRARKRVLVGYFEQHHILPRCMGGGEEYENIVSLTAEEHFCAHLLLIKIYPENRKLIHAANLMRVRCNNNKTYGWLRRLHAMAISNVHRGRKFSLEHKTKIGAANRLRILSNETKNKISVSRSGKGVGNKNATGTKRTKEQKQRLSETLRGNKHALGFRGYKHSAEIRKKISVSKLGIKRGPLTDEWKSKISVKLIGNTNRRDYYAAMRTG